MSMKKPAFTRAKNTFKYAKNIIALTFFILAVNIGIFSAFLNSVILLLMALGLVIWGTMLLLATTQKVVKVNLVSLYLNNATLALNSLLSRFGYNGLAIINPPVTIGDKPTLQIFRTDRKKKNISLTPLGLDLAFVIEKKSPIDLFLIDLESLSDFLSKLFTDELELANGFIMSRENNLIRIKMTDFVFQDLCSQIEDNSLNVCKRLLCPICGSLACIISKATHKSVSLDSKLFDTSNTLEICFRTHEPKELLK